MHTHLYMYLYMYPDVCVYIYIYIYTFMLTERENTVFTITLYVNLSISIYDNSVIPTFTTRHSQKNECHLEVPLTLFFLHWCGLSYSYEFGFSPPS